MRFGIVVFPGTWSDGDCNHVLESPPRPGRKVPLAPGHPSFIRTIRLCSAARRFSYGDYLRAGAIARFSPVMGEVERFAARGGLVIGICNGFQVLCEAGLLPGALMLNSHVQYRCLWTDIRVERSDTAFTAACAPGQVLRIPISHGEGNYFADQANLLALEERGQVVFRYSTPSGELSPEANPNGSANNIAGIVNREGNVLGMMPHPRTVLRGTLGRYRRQADLPIRNRAHVANPSQLTFLPLDLHPGLW